jgi:ABC-2 type transport system permease protein
MLTLLVREFQEYRNSLLITPLAIAATLTLFMLASVLLADRISLMGEVVFDSLLSSQTGKEMTVTIQIDDDSTQIEQHYIIREQEEPIADEDWNFSRGWSFNSNGEPEQADQVDDGDTKGALNTLFNVIHSFMLLVLIAVTINYLLGSLFNDRKDRSILFWKSMPVSDWEQVRTKLLVALVAAPTIYIATSYLMQLITVLLSLMLVWRMDGEPVATILGNIDLLPLAVNPVVSWLVTALWLAPLYAWLLLASAGARRSPFMLALAPVIALVVLEEIFLGSEFLGNVVSQHVPHYNSNVDAVGIYFEGNEWMHIDFLKMGCGLLFAAVAIWATVWLRRYRFEL